MQFWSFVFSIAAAQGAFLALVLFFKKENRGANRFLGGFLLLLALTLFEWILWWTQTMPKVPGLMGLSMPFPLLYGPLFFLFYRVSFEKTTLSRRDLIHFLPALATAALMSPFYLRFQLPDHKLFPLTRPIVTHPAFIAAIFIQMSAYGLGVARRFYPRWRERRGLLRWHLLMLLLYLGIILTYLVYRLAPTAELTDWRFFIAAALTLFIYFVAWLGYVQPQVFSGIPLSEAMNPLKYRRSALDTEAAQALFEKIKTLIGDEKGYADDQLNLEVLAQRLNASRHHVSQAINECARHNFFDFINAYRIEEAKRLLRATTKQEKNVIEVAYAVGFNSKKAFNTAFKKMTGMTPTEFRKRGRERK